MVVKNVNVIGGTMIIEALRLRYESQIAEAKAKLPSAKVGIKFKIIFLYIIVV